MTDVDHRPIVVGIIYTGGVVLGITALQLRRACAREIGEFVGQSVARVLDIDVADTCRWA